MHTYYCLCVCVLPTVLVQKAARVRTCGTVRVGAHVRAWMMCSYVFYALYAFYAWWIYCVVWHRDVQDGSRSSHAHACALVV